MSSPARRISVPWFAAVLVLCLLGAGCSPGGFEHGDAVNRLVGAGVDEAVAECIVDGLTSELGPDVLDEERDPTHSEQVALERIRAACDER